MYRDERDITTLLQDWAAGDEEALERLMTSVYEELERLAARQRRRERANHSLETHALIHEAFLRLIQQDRVLWSNRSHFFAIASRVMRRVLVDQARHRGAQKRQAFVLAAPLEDDDRAAGTVLEDVERLEDALQALEAVNERQGRVVELRYFGGFSISEVAEILEVSAATIKKDWARAKVFLFGELYQG